MSASREFCFVHAADLHLGGTRWLRTAPLTRELRQLVQKADRLAFENLLDLCLVERARFLLVAGDIIDGWCRDFRVALWLGRALERLNGSGCDVLLLAGNHDVRSRGLGHLLLPQHVHLLGRQVPETRIFEDVNVAIHGWSCPEVEAEGEVSALYPAPESGRFNIGLLHTSAEGVRGHADYAPTSRLALRRKGYDYWALGHVHARTVVCEEPWIVFPGNLQARGARETGSKGASLVRVSNGRVASCEHRALDVLRFVNVFMEAEGVSALGPLGGLVHAALLGARRGEEHQLSLGRAPALMVQLSLGGASVGAEMLSLSREERVEFWRSVAARAAGFGLHLDDVWLELPGEGGGFQLELAA